MPHISPVFKSRMKRIGIIMGISVAVFFLFLFVLISPIAKYLIEKYDDKILGRTIELSWVYVNPFTGYVYLKNVRVMENNNDTLFFRADAISADLSMFKLLKKNIEISTLTVYHPWGHIVQNKRAINFKDIIDFYKPKDGTIKVNKKRLKFSILDCTIKDGIFQYDEVTIPVTYYIKHVNVYSPGKWWDADTMLFKVSLESGPYKGTINGNLSINFKTQDYRFGGAIDTFDVKPLSQYMRVLSNYGDFGGVLNAKIDGEGNFKNRFDLKTAGLISINQFQFGPSIYEDYGSFQRLVLDFTVADPAGKKYRIDSIMLDRPYFRYERYDSLDNLSLMFGKRGSKKGLQAGAQFNLILKIAEYLQQLLRNFAQSDYQIDKFTVYKGNFVFKDFSPYERFMVDAMPVHITGDSINKNNPRLKLDLKTVVRPYGDININVSLDPKNYGNFDIDYGINNVPVSVFNPYLLTYTSFPLNKGKLQLNGRWHVVDSMITSTNHLLIIDPHVGKRMKHRGTKWIPLPLIMSVAREAGEVIDYEIPVKGNLKHPEFDLHYVILDVVKNIFVKPPLTPYLMRIKRMEKTVEKMVSVDWDARRSVLELVEFRFLHLVARHLQQNPGSIIKIEPLVYEAKEREHIAFFEGKKKYFLLNRPRGYKVREEDSMVIEQMSTKDPGFIRYLDRLAVDSMMFSTEQKCRYAVGDELIEVRFQQLNNARKKTFLNVFEETNTVSQVKFGKSEMGIPFNGFSRFKINYNGNVPERLQNAYEEIEEANTKTPRKKHKSERWLPKIKGVKKG